MKKNYVFAVVAVLAVILLFFILTKRPARQIAEKPSVMETNLVNSPAIRPTATAVSIQVEDDVPPPGTNRIAWFAKQREKRKALAEHYNDEWRTPIEFYGRVVDESNNAIAGVQIDYSCNDLSPEGTSNYHGVSDENGMFSLKDITGKLLVVHVAKDGYYTSRLENNSFEYGENHTVADPGNPVVFHLRKKTTGAALIHFDKGFPIPKDGTPVLIDLSTGGVVSEGKNVVKIECWTHDDVKKEGWKFDWNCRISVPGGGLQVEDEEFAFLAPDDNYEPFDNIDMAVKPEISWAPSVNKNYYVRTGDGKYARIALQMVAHGDHFCQINSYFNPDSSRNLEPQ